MSKKIHLVPDDEDTPFLLPVNKKILQFFLDTLILPPEIWQAKYCENCEAQIIESLQKMISEFDDVKKQFDEMRRKKLEEHLLSQLNTQRMTKQ